MGWIERGSQNEFVSWLFFEGLTGNFSPEKFSNTELSRIFPSAHYFQLVTP